jgi:hypothetical protein
MCLRNAQSKNKGSLPYKFWNTKPWDWTFLRQKIAADKLIKQYGESVVMKAVTSTEFEKIFSLNNKRCVSIIEKYAKIQEAIKEEPPKQEIEAKETPELRKRTFGKKKSLNKLRGLDVKKEE